MAKQKKVMESEIIADDITRDCNSFEAWFIENGKLRAVKSRYMEACLSDQCK